MKKIYTAFVFSVLAFFAGYYFGADAAAMLEEHTGIVLPTSSEDEARAIVVARVSGVTDGKISLEDFRVSRALEIVLPEGDAACAPGGYTVTRVSPGAAPVSVVNPGSKHSDAAAFLLDGVARGDMVTFTDIIAVCDNGFTASTPPVVLKIS